jgi:hypothetical protein
VESPHTSPPGTTVRKKKKRKFKMGKLSQEGFYTLCVSQTTASTSLQEGPVPAVDGKGIKCREEQRAGIRKTTQGP